MLKTVLFFSALFYISLSAAQSTSKKLTGSDFPSCELVLTHVAENLNYLPISEHTLSLAKKEEGYFLIITRYNRPDWDVVAYIHVWSQKTGEYLIPKLGKFQGEEASLGEVRAYFSKDYRDLENFDFYKFYGYPNYEEDLINFLAPNNELSLYEYELLARAHSNLAGRYIHPTVGGVPPDFAKDFKLSNYEKISPERIEKALEQIDKAMMYWNHIEKVNPNYEPHIISNIHMKIANEKMHFWSFLMSVCEPELAQKLLDQVNYSSIDLDVAKRLLDNCDQNGFLFTNGDSDTFPLWYLQEKQGYRSDVVVLNVSLMQTDWYLSMNKARRKYQTNFTAEEYKEFNALVVFAYDDGEASIESIITETIPNLEGKIPEEGYILIPKNVTIDVGNDEETQLEALRNVYFWQMAAFDLIISNPEATFFTTEPTMTWRDLGLKKNGVSRGSISQLISGKGGERTQIDRNAHEHYKTQIEKMDFSRMNDSYLARHEYQYLIANFSSSNFLFNTEYEKVGAQLIQAIDLELIASLDDPNTVLATVHLFEELGVEKAQLLRSKYMKKAKEIIGGLDDFGVNYLVNQSALAGIFELYSGKLFYERFSYDSHEESAVEKELLSVLKSKLETIQSNISEDTQYRTSYSVDYFLQILERLN